VAVADRALEERRWSTPELLSVEQQLVVAATGRTDEQAAVVSHDAIRAALAAHPTAGEDQQAMVRDVCQGGAGVALVVGKAGTGKTFTLGMARHAWQLDGYRPLATAPTGIATVSLEAEGFEEVATCDRLLADLDHGRERLDGRTVLVVDEAGMLGSRKLARLLEHAEQDPAQDVIVLAGRRAEVDRLNVACQELLAAQGRLGPDRLQVEDRRLAVGNRVVCGRNAIDKLGIANGTRGTITALDPDARSITIRVDGKEPREVTLPGWYLDGRSRGGSATAGWIWPMPPPAIAPKG
jgi:ATP-dependent exoDNAse (exonuclease V) alpha subunit